MNDSIALVAPVELTDLELDAVSGGLSFRRIRRALEEGVQATFSSTLTVNSTTYTFSANVTATLGIS